MIMRADLCILEVIFLIYIDSDFLNNLFTMLV